MNINHKESFPIIIDIKEVCLRTFDSKESFL